MAFVFLDRNTFVADVDSFSEELVTGLRARDCDGCCGECLVRCTFVDRAAPGDGRDGERVEARAFFYVSDVLGISWVEVSIAGDKFEDDSMCLLADLRVGPELCCEFFISGYVVSEA